MNWARKEKSVLKKKQVWDVFSKHEHYWVPAVDPSAQICNCGKWLISAEEADRRREEWSAFFKFIRNTPAYLDWVEMSQAFREKNKPQIVKILERVRSRCKRVAWNGEESDWEFNYDYQPVPNFPDPDNFPYIISS